MEEKTIEQKIDEELKERKQVRSEIVAEMLSVYHPTEREEEADYEVTSQELADTFADIVAVSADDISYILHKLGFKLARRGSKFLWQMRTNP